MKLPSKTRQYIKVDFGWQNGHVRSHNVGGLRLHQGRVVANSKNRHRDRDELIIAAAQMSNNSFPTVQARWNQEEKMRAIRFHSCIVLLLLSAGFWTGCAARIVDDSQLQYLDPEFTVSSLFDHGLGLLPVVAGQGQEGLRRPLAAKLEAHLTAQLPEGRFYGAIQMLDLINEANLTEAYAQMIGDYEQAAILNKRTLREIGKATGIRYLLHVKLLDQSRTERLAKALLSTISSVWRAKTLPSSDKFGIAAWATLFGKVRARLPQRLKLNSNM